MSGVFEDDDVQSFAMRQKVIDSAEERLSKASIKDARALRTQIWREMQDDQGWMEDHAVQDSRDLDLPAYWEHQRVRINYITFFNIALLSR